MPYREVQFAGGEVYHTIFRGIDEMLLFKDLDDYFRGIFSIYEFNDLRSVSIAQRRRDRERFKKLVRGRASDQLNDVIEKEDERHKMVDILAFCLMPNHIHLLLRQMKESGVQKFMVKLGSGFGGYFNRKYERKGYVFQNRFQAVYVKDDRQLLVAANYIHANPISLIEPSFKELGIRGHSPEQVMEFLKNGHRWSSFPDYAGLKNFPSVTERSFIAEMMGGQAGPEANLRDWILHKKELADYEKMLNKLETA